MIHGYLLSIPDPVGNIGGGVDRIGGRDEIGWVDNIVKFGEVKFDGCSRVEAEDVDVGDVGGYVIVGGAFVGADDGLDHSFWGGSAFVFRECDAGAGREIFRTRIFYFLTGRPPCRRHIRFLSEIM